MIIIDARIVLIIALVAFVLKMRNPKKKEEQNNDKQNNDE